MYAVQKGVPLPKVRKPTATSRRKYPFEEMAVGEFFFIPNKTRNTITAHASAVGKQLDKKFSTRLTYMSQDENGVWGVCDADAEGATLGVGVWREK